MTSEDRRTPLEMSHLDQRVLDRLAAEPASFQDLVDEGLMDRGDAATVRNRLVERGLIEPTGYWSKTGKPGKPRVQYRIKDASTR